MNTQLKTVSITGVINASPQSVWKVVRSADGVDKWAPGITACRLEGAAVPGVKRVCSMGDKQLIERIETIDDIARVFQYRITEQEVMPIRNPFGTLHVSEAANGKAHVLWLLNFEMIDEQAWPMVQEGLTQMYRAGLEGLEKYAAAR
jgi:uncharacterized protein YndB with AHSA1/START domain